MCSAAAAMAGMWSRKRSRAASKPGLSPLCWWTASHASSPPSSPRRVGRRTIQALRCGDWAPPSSPRPHHQVPRRARPHSTRTRSSSGARKPTADWYLGWATYPGSSDCSAWLSLLQARWSICRWMKSSRYRAVPSSSSTCERLPVAAFRIRTPSPLLRWVGFRTTSPLDKGSRQRSARNLRTSSRTAALSWTASSSGICGTPRLSIILLRRSLSPKAWIVALPSLCTFIASMRPHKSSLRSELGQETSKSRFISKSRAARAHGAKSSAPSAPQSGSRGTGTIAVKVPPTATPAGTPTTPGRAPPSPETSMASPGEAPGGAVTTRGWKAVPSRQQTCRAKPGSASAGTLMACLPSGKSAQKAPPAWAPSGIVTTNQLSVPAARLPRGRGPASGSASLSATWQMQREDAPDAALSSRGSCAAPAPAASRSQLLSAASRSALLSAAWCSRQNQAGTLSSSSAASLLPRRGLSSSSAVSLFLGKGPSSLPPSSMRKNGALGSSSPSPT
mmetsp:Transcript_27681/g.73117  ORF Transcript_27681/g.73117 Transcript_27681/m.73117 type:complete len:505 (-) Transcript_27681:464-1978(-)